MPYNRYTICWKFRKWLCPLHKVRVALLFLLISLISLSSLKSSHAKCTRTIIHTQVGVSLSVYMLHTLSELSQHRGSFCWHIFILFEHALHTLCTQFAFVVHSFCALVNHILHMCKMCVLNKILGTCAKCAQEVYICNMCAVCAH